MEPTVEVRMLGRNDHARIGEIDRTEHIDALIEQQGTELVPRRGSWTALAWDPHGDGEHSVEAQRRAISGYTDAGGMALGAFREGRMVAIGILIPHIRPTVAQLAYLHVSADCRSTGIGRHLTEELEHLARDAGDTEIVVSATPSENTVRFYLARGYRPVADPIPERFELEPEDIHMAKPL
jgi:GNAT superfamily N-acetyltransferase